MIAMADTIENGGGSEERETEPDVETVLGRRISRLFTRGS